MTGSACSYDAVYEEDLPGFLAVKTHFWDKGHPDVELYLRRRTIDGDWIWLKAKAVSYVADDHNTAGRALGFSEPNVSSVASS